MKQKIEKRRVLLLLPIFLLPLLTLAFYALGGGGANVKADTITASGINTQLPAAKFIGDTLTDKISLYNKNRFVDTSDTEIRSLANKFGFNGSAADPQAKAIEEKLAALNQEIAEPAERYPTSGQVKTSSQDAGIAKDVDKLELLMKSMQSGSGEDPEMKQLADMLQSIQEIQNPELAKLKYHTADKPASEESLFSTIPAAIEGDQKVVQGSVVKLRLMDTVVLNGQVIPKGHLIFGLAAFSNQRLNLDIKNIRLGNSIVPVNLTVFDRQDAMSGINAPEALLTDAVNGGVVDAASGIGITGFDLTTQIAGAGIDAAKSLLTKKLRRIKQPLKSGYPLLLRDNTKKQDRSLKNLSYDQQK